MCGRNFLILDYRMAVIKIVFLFLLLNCFISYEFIHNLPIFPDQLASIKLNVHASVAFSLIDFCAFGQELDR